GDKLLGDTNVVIGKDATSTPTGTFFITEKIARPPSGAYGPWILATSGYSETLDDFDGGLPQVALHGTNNPSLIGTKASNGCVRMPNDSVLQLAFTIPAGTPLVIND
ncbi:MAG TPA: L,D-transpeptidase, partial [Acidimicrobiales bacterium]